MRRQPRTRLVQGNDGYYSVVSEPIYFIMERRMMLGIRERAEVRSTEASRTRTQRAVD